MIPIAVDENGSYFTPSNVKSLSYTKRTLYCPCCGMELIPKVNGDIRAPHFSHKYTGVCTGGEGSTHKNAKNMIASNIKEYIFINKCKKCNSEKRQQFMEDYNKCIVEMINGDFIVDIGILDSFGEIYAAIEVHNTNSISPYKSSYLSKKFNDLVFEVEAEDVLSGKLTLHSRLECSHCNPFKKKQKVFKMENRPISVSDATIEDEEDRRLFTGNTFISGETTKLSGTAGSGKTTLIHETMRKNPNKNFLFMCYNKSLQKELEYRFEDMENVDVYTFDSIWHYIYHKKMGKRSESSFKEDWLFKYIQYLNQYLDGKCELHEFSPEKKEWIEVCLLDKTWWNFKRMSREIYDSGKMNINLNFNFMKDFLHKYDVIICDESQDMQPMTFKIIDEIMNKYVHVVYAGDPCQQLYQFNGAIDAMSLVKTNKEYVLHKTFRFGQDTCNTLNHSKVNKYTTFPGVSHTNTPIVRYSQFSEYKSMTYTFLFRKVSSMIMEAESLAKENIHVSIDFEKRLKDLRKQKEQMMLSKELGEKVYANKDWLMNISEDRLNEMNNLFTKMKPVDGKIFVELSTVHKYKGLEANIVRIHSDIFDEKDLNIRNVAITRAKKLLVLP